MRRGLSSIDHAERPGPSGTRAHFGDRVDRAQHVRDVRERRDARAPGQQALERLEVERAVLPEGNRFQNGTAVPRRQLPRSEEHTSELQSLTNLVCRLLLEKKKE